MGNTVDAPKSILDKTVTIFDSYYNFDMNVDANQYEIVRSYFKDVSKSDTVANNFSTMIFRIASITGENALDLLSYIQGQSKTKLEATAIMTYYLNSIKSKSALYGISTIPHPNDNVQRNVLI